MHIKQNLSHEWSPYRALAITRDEPARDDPAQALVELDRTIRPVVNRTAWLALDRTTQSKLPTLVHS
jgi:hypothetical protein